MRDSFREVVNCPPDSRNAWPTMKQAVKSKGPLGLVFLEGFSSKVLRGAGEGSGEKTCLLSSVEWDGTGWRHSDGHRR